MALAWENDTDWIVRNKNFVGFASPYVGNGMLGTRVGILVLGTDPQAPAWQGAANIPQRLYMHWGDPDNPLPTFSAFVYDSFQYALPAWNQLKLTIGTALFAPQNGRHDFVQSLDLRTGEATLVDKWFYAPGKQAVIKIRMLLPRTHPNSSLWELEVTCDTDAITAEFGLQAEHLAHDLPMRYERTGDSVLGTAKTRERGRLVAQGLAWQSNGAEISSRVEGPVARLGIKGKNQTLQLTVFHAVHGGLEQGDAVQNVKDDLTRVALAWKTDLRVKNSAIWKTLWASALRVDELPRDDARLVLISQYYLLASMDTKPYPLSPLGVSCNDWDGAQLWDAECWLFPVLLPLWPHFARKILEYRLNLLPAMRAFARENGLRGAWFPCMHDENGQNVTPGQYLPEIHLNIWIAHAAWKLYQETHDEKVLKEMAWPLLREAADFFVSRCEQDADGSWHLRRVMGPDEAVAERYHTTCDDNVLTNAGVRWLTATTLKAADLLGEKKDPLWQTISEQLTILPTRSDKVIPEHAQYIDQEIKQADTILAFFVKFLDAPEDVIRATLDFYRDKVSPGGPLMTSQIEAGVLLMLGDTEEGMQRLFTRYREYVRGPFLVPFECLCNDTAVMLTGIEGLLQALIYGFYKWEIGSSKPLPRMGDAW